MSIAILIPSTSEWKAQFGMSLACLCSKLGSDNIPHTLFNTQLSILPFSRHSMLKQAINEGFKYALFLDSDMTFPNDTAHHLIGADKDIIGANYVVKSMKSRWTAVKDEKVLSSTDKSGIERVDRVATGILLIKCDTIKEMSDPYFDFTWLGQHHGGEDFYFCNKAKEMGIESWVHHGLSQKIGHVGSYEFNSSNVG
jgi:hypothetical protein